MYARGERRTMSLLDVHSSAAVYVAVDRRPETNWPQTRTPAVDPEMRYVLARAIIAERLAEGSRERLAAALSAAARDLRPRLSAQGLLLAICGRRLAAGSSVAPGESTGHQAGSCRAAG
jgi:hypothetical protein